MPKAIMPKEPKYKRGDRVRVKSLKDIRKIWTVDTREGFYKRTDHPTSFNKNMVRFCGKFVTIDRVFDSNRKYRILEDHHEWTWIEDMLDDNCNDLVYEVLRGK